MQGKLTVPIEISSTGEASVVMYDGEKRRINVSRRFLLQIGYKPWFGKTIFFNLLTAEYSFTLQIVLECIYGVKCITPSFIEKGLHTAEKPCTFIIGKRWRMRIIQQKP